MKKVIPSKLS